MPNKIAIVGGGFGGIYTLLALQKSLPTSEIYIFNKDSDFVFTPLLHEAATGGVGTDNIAVPIRSFIKSCNVKFINDTVVKIDTDSSKVISLSSEYYFDYLILATGSDSNSYDTKGVYEHCLFLKTINDALSIKRRIISNLEKYCITQDLSLLSITVIGGGPTGVELAFEIDEFISTTLTKYFRDETIKDYLIVNLICSSSSILDSMPINMQNEAVKRLKHTKIKFIGKTYAREVTKHGVKLDNGDFISSYTVIWCAGVKPTLPNFTINNLKMNLNPNLTLGDFSNIYAIGDCVNYGTTIPMDAQAAVKQANYVATSIKDKIHNKPSKKAFVYKSSGQLISLGRWHAAGVIFGIPISGPIAWWVWRTVYLIRFPSRSKRFKIMIDWTISLFSERDMSNI